MAPLFRFLLLLMVGLVHCSISNATDRLYYVQQTDNEDGANCSLARDQSCLTLNDYATNTSLYFVDNTTFMFLPGTHQLNVELKLEFLSNVKFTAYSGDEEQYPCVLLSNTSVSISCTTCHNIEISRLTFVVSGPSSPSRQTAAGDWTVINILNRASICTLSNVNFIANNRMVRAVKIMSSSSIIISNVHISGFTSIDGPAIRGVSSTIDFYGNNSFVNNTATNFGGAIAFSACTSSFYGNNAFRTLSKSSAQCSSESMAEVPWGDVTVSYGNTFSGNTAKLGGAFYSSGGTISFYGSNSFLNNVASENGGALYVRGLELRISGCSLLENSCSQDSSGLVADYSQINCTNNTGTVTFRDNTASRDGGAIYVYEGSLRIMSGGASFMSNTAFSGSGGAVYIFIFGHIDINDSHVNFTNNSAHVGGGAVYIIGGIANHSMSGRIWFVQNGADRGGALRVQSVRGAARLPVPIERTNLSICGELVFMYNTARLEDGGALLIQRDSYCFMSGVLLLTRNTAVRYGGAIGISDKGECSISGNVTFSYNIAAGGGAISIHDFGFLNIFCNILFINNTADDGGALFTHTSTAVVAGNVSFVNNSALRYNGGAICVYSTFNFGILNLTGTVNFIANSAVQGSGGAMAFYDPPELSLLSPLEANFTGNYAKLNGGVMYFEAVFTPVRCSPYGTRIVSCPIRYSSRLC